MESYISQIRGHNVQEEATYFVNSPGGGLSPFLKSDIQGPSSKKPLSIDTEDCDEHAVHFIAGSNTDDDGAAAMQHIVGELRRFTEEDEDIAENENEIEEQDSIEEEEPASVSKVSYSDLILNRA